MLKDISESILLLRRAPPFVRLIDPLTKVITLFGFCDLVTVAYKLPSIGP